MARQISNLIDLEPPFAIGLALKQIEADYGERCYIKPKMLAKFGRFNNLGSTLLTVQEHGGVEVMLEDNLIDSVVSTDAGDDQEIRIEGFTRDGSGNLSFIVQTVTLNGTTNVTLPTPIARGNRVTNEGSTSFAGTVKVFDATTPAVIYVQAEGVYNRSQKAATSISSLDYWIIEQVYGGVLKRQAASVDFSLQMRKLGGVFQEIYGWHGTSSSSDAPHDLKVPLIIPSNSDVRIQAVADATGVEVIARMSGYLALSGQFG